MEKMPRISVAIATHDTVPFRFAYDLAQMTAFTMASIPEKVPYGISAVSGTYVHSAREELIRSLLQDGVTHLLWLDSDMSFPRDSFIRLMNHNVPFVGANYAKREVPSDYVAIKEVGTPGKKCPTTVESTGLEEVEAIGFGLCLMRADALLDLNPDERWFWFEAQENGGMVGEDVWFWRKVREAGHKVYVDHDISKEVSHIGQFEYTLNMVEADPENMIVPVELELPPGVEV